MNRFPADSCSVSLNPYLGFERYIQKRLLKGAISISNTQSPIIDWEIQAKFLFQDPIYTRISQSLETN